MKTTSDDDNDDNDKVFSYRLKILPRYKIVLKSESKCCTHTHTHTNNYEIHWMQIHLYETQCDAMLCYSFRIDSQSVNS